MNEFRPVRSLIRGLDVLRALNRLGGATVSEMAGEIQLSRGTVYRMFQTLSASGYVFKDESDSRYRLLLKVRELSDGYLDDDWVPKIAKPLIEKLCSEIIWPISIATCNGTRMILRETTDKNSPLALRRIGGGFEVPIFGSAAGRVYLAFSDKDQRKALITILSRLNSHQSDSHISNNSLVENTLNEVRKQGFSIVKRPDLKQAVIAVPILVKKQIFATLALRYIESAVNDDEAVLKFLDPLKRTAINISNAYESNQIL